MKFNRSEWTFLIIGTLMVISSLVLIGSGFSFLTIRNHYLTPSDPFQGTYAVLSLENPVPTVTPFPTIESNREKTFLLFPAAGAVLTKTGLGHKGYPIRFKFEAEPKETSCTFELRFENKVIISKSPPKTETGSHEISILIRKPGLYQWQILTPNSVSETRELTIKE
jgi:hypothetical protein